MKNILDENPNGVLRGRLRASGRFVHDQDLHGKRVLDIGCGFGWFEVEALKRGVGSIIGIEMTEKDLATAKAHVRDSRARFEIGGALKVPLPDAGADTVVSWEVIEHIPKGTESKMFAEVSRVLAPGGTFYLSTPNATFFSNALDPAWWLIGHRHYRTKDLERYGAAHGLVAEEPRVVAGWLTLLEVLNMYVAKWVFRRRPFFEDWFMKRLDEEYARPGFVNVFIRFRKSA